MEKEKQFERQAEIAEKIAEEARDSEAKQTWHDIAAHWRAMAAQAKRNGW